MVGILREVSVTRVIVLLIRVVVLHVVRWVPLGVLVMIDASLLIKIVVI